MSSPRYSCCILRAAAACRMLHASFLPGNQRTCSCLCCCCCCGWGAASCYCCKLFMHFEVYLKHESKRSALLSSALLCPGQEFHSMAFQMLFFLASRIFSLLFVDFMYCFSCFTCPKWGRSRGRPCLCPAATYGHLNLPPTSSLSLPLVHTSSHFLGRAANNLCVFP